MRYASLCDGIGAVHCAWQPLGWKCLWTSEIEPFPIAVVDERWGFKNVGDMTAITEETLHEVSPESVELLVGGTPCQSFSVAGLRKGLDDPRGNLALRFIQLAAVLKPRWIVWENVPGVLSSGKGRDFGTFLGALEQVGYGWAYRTLDAQWFGVAQRRRRVFVVAHLGDWRRAAAVLFESESVFGNPPSRGEQGKEASRATSSGPRGRGGKTGVDVSPTIDANVDRKFGSNQWVDGGMGVLQGAPAGHNPEVSKSLMSGGGHRLDTDTDTFIVQKPVSFHPTQDPISATDGTTHALGCGSKLGCATAAVAFQSNMGSRGGDVFEDQSPTVRTGPAKGGNPPAVAFKPSHFTRGKDGAPSEVASPLTADADRGDQDQVVACSNTGAGWCNNPEDVAATVRRECDRASVMATAVIQPTTGFDGGQSGNPKATHQATVEGTGSPTQARPHCIASPMAVRRLTPVECERLQGFPDNYTAVTFKKKPAADGPRYRALGNSMAVPVMAWIGKRIEMVEAIATAQEK